jgi:hypothetical protein
MCVCVCVCMCVCAHKLLMRKMKEDLNKYKNVSGLWIQNFCIAIHVYFFPN